MSGVIEDAPRVELDPHGRTIAVSWSDGFNSRFHYVWLRHSGRCPRGMPNDTSVKIDLLPDDPAILEISACRVEGDE